MILSVMRGSESAWSGLGCGCGPYSPSLLCRLLAVLELPPTSYCGSQWKRVSLRDADCGSELQ